MRVHGRRHSLLIGSSGSVTDWSSPCHMTVTLPEDDSNRPDKRVNNNMETERQALLTLLSLLQAIVQLNSAFKNTAAAYMRKRRAIIKAISNKPHLNRRKPHIERRFWVKPGRSSAWWNMFLNGAVAPEEWRQNFRMSKSTLVQLSKTLQPFVEGERTRMRAPVNVLTKVACTVYYLSDEARLRKTASAFGLSKQVVSVIVRQVCKAISLVLGPDYIRTPKTEREVQELVAGFAESRGIPQCLGALDCTHIEIKKPSCDPTDFINSKRKCTLKVQALCDHKHRFVDVNVNNVWPGGVPDARVFADSQLRRELQDGIIPSCPKQLLEDERPVPVFVLGDVAFPLTPYLMTEYPGGGVTVPERLYGESLRGARAVIERAFGRLKARFAALRRSMDINMKDLPYVIHACFVLHNYCESLREPVSEERVNAAVRYERSFQPPAVPGPDSRTDQTIKTEGERMLTLGVGVTVLLLSLLVTYFISSKAELLFSSARETPATTY